MKANDLVIRDSTAEDVAALQDLLVQAFPGEDLRPLVTQLLEDPQAEPRVSLVAAKEARLMGHVLFTAAAIEGRPGVTAALLAPLAVRPEAQDAGVGSRLVWTGLDRLRDAQVAAALVFGDPSYYARFGFAPAERLGIAPPYPLTKAVSDAWQALPLGPASSGALSGRLRPAPAFDAPELWAPPPEE